MLLLQHNKRFPFREVVEQYHVLESGCLMTTKVHKETKNKPEWTEIILEGGPYLRDYLKR